MYLCTYVVTAKQCHTDTWIKTKPLRNDLGASTDKSNKALDGCPCRWLRLTKAARRNCQGQERLVPSRAYHNSRN